MAKSRRLEKRQIKLSLPGYFKKESRLQTINILEDHARELRHFPVQVLTEIVKYLHDFNRTKQLSARRYELIEGCVTIVTPLINSVFCRYYKTHPLPEDDEKRELLTLAGNACNELAIGYMRLFEHDMNLSMLRYNRARERISHCGHRIMDLVYAEQRLRTLRYQDLASDIWKNVNIVFSSVYCFEDHKFQMQTLGLLHIAPALSLKASKGTPQQTAKSRIVAMYISIQLNASIDMFSMATQQSQIAASKVRQYVNTLSVSQDLDVATPEDHIITYSSFASAASSGSLSKDAMEFSIDISAFKKNIAEEFKKIDTLLTCSLESDHENEGSSTTADGVSVAQHDIEIRICLATILDRLSLHERSEERNYIGHMDPLFIFNGYKSCFNIMSAVRKLRENKQQSNDEIQDQNILTMLSQRSATIADDHTKEESSKWLISNSSNNGVLAETRETRFTQNMFVGQLLLYGIGEISSAEFTLAYISRMHRDAGDKLLIAISNLSKKAELVVVQSAQLKKSALGLPGILLADYVDGLGVILHTSHRLPPGTAITLSRSEKPYQYSIGAASVIQREFTLFQLVS